MRILLITNLWIGVKDFFFKGKEDISGMPAFYNVFIRLLNSDKVEKVFVITFINSKPQKLNIPVKYINKIEVYPFFFRSKIELLLKSILASILSLFLILSKRINVISGHGAIGFIAGIVSIFSGIPNIRRLYGSFLINEIESSKLALFVKHPFEYLAFCLPAKAIIITNDGTHGDIVYHKIGNRRAELFFLLNSRPSNNYSDAQLEKLSELNLPEKYISYIARIDEWKRQHLLLEALQILARENINIPAIIVGPIFNPDYYNKICEFVKVNFPAELIKIIPGLPRPLIYQVLKQSEFTLSLYETSNLGNVFLESLTSGTPIIGLNINNSLSDFPENIYYSIKENSVDTIAEAIKKLWFDDNLKDQLSSLSRDFALNNLLTEDKRAEIEIELLFEYMK
ncbi:MAG: glycosyltransferase [Candidatus Cloacimonetes bacterium]|nr:glycosyltransferase [Candidatus Cloacimonadota bacterium]